MSNGDSPFVSVLTQRDCPRLTHLMNKEQYMDIILGTSGEERAKLIYEKAVKLSQDEKNKILIIVPEQYTLETQKGIVKAHPRHAIMNIDVVSFNRLAYKVLEKTGSGNLPMLRETGKNMIKLSLPQTSFSRWSITIVHPSLTC